MVHIMLGYHETLSMWLPPEGASSDFVECESQTSSRFKGVSERWCSTDPRAEIFQVDAEYIISVGAMMIERRVAIDSTCLCSKIFKALMIGVFCLTSAYEYQVFRLRLQSVLTSATLVTYQRVHIFPGYALIGPSPRICYIASSDFSEVGVGELPVNYGVKIMKYSQSLMPVIACSSDANFRFPYSHS